MQSAQRVKEINLFSNHEMNYCAFDSVYALCVIHFFKIKNLGITGHAMIILLLWFFFRNRHRNFRF